MERALAGSIVYFSLTRLPKETIRLHIAQNTHQTLLVGLEHISPSHATQLTRIVIVLEVNVEGVVIQKMSLLKKIKPNTQGGCENKIVRVSVLKTSV